MRAAPKPLLVCAALVLGASAMAKPLRYAEDHSPGIVHPAFATSMAEARVHELVFESLFTDDKELRSSPSLATGFALADDRLSVVVELRAGVTWHDGEPFTADDVVFTIEAMKNPRTASPEAGRVSWIKSAVAVDSATVQLHFGAEEYAPEDKLHFKILPKHAFASTTLKRTDSFRNRPIGTGPYAIESFNGDNSITLRRYNDHWGTAGLSEVVLREVADKNYQAKLLIYQSIEALVRVLPRDLATLQGDRKVELYPYQTNSWWYIGYNHGNGQLGDPRVREALSLMMDVEGLLAPIGTGDIVSGPFVRSSPFYNHDVAPLAQDADRASALLKEAGYTLSNRQWTHNGEPLSFRLATIANLETAQDVVINLQTQMQNQGVKLEPVFLSSAEWKEKVWRDGDFDLILSQWSFDRNEDIYEQFHSSGSRNFVGYASTAVDKLLERARDAHDPQEKKDLLRQVHAAVAADHPMRFLWTLDSYSAMSVKVRNVVVHPFYFFTWVRDWTLR